MVEGLRNQVEGSFPLVLWSLASKIVGAAHFCCVEGRNGRQSCFGKIQSWDAENIAVLVVVEQCCVDGQEDVWYFFEDWSPMRPLFLGWGCPEFGRAIGNVWR